MHLFQYARAIHQTASRKATGSDEVSAELFKAGGETILDIMHRTCVAIWETVYGEWSEVKNVFHIHPTYQDRWSETVCKLQNNACSCLPCKQDPSSNHTGKDPSEDRNGNCRQTEGIATKQGGKDRITNLRILMHKARDHQQPLYICFVDFKKAFDSKGKVFPYSLPSVGPGADPGVQAVSPCDVKWITPYTRQ